MGDPRITRIEVHEYEFHRNDLGTDYNGFNLVYEPGGKIGGKGYIVRILTDVGVVGEYAGGSQTDYATLPLFAHYLIGKNALERERFFTDITRALRRSTSHFGTWRASCTTRPCTDCWAATKRVCHAMPAPTTAITSLMGCPPRRRLPILQKHVPRWAIRPSRSMAGAGRPSSRRWRRCTQWAGGWEGAWI